MKKVFIVSCLASIIQLHSQNDSDEVSLDLLKAPSSPGFILLNQQPTDIERPANPTDFAISFRNSTNNFTALPKNYAVEVAPTWLFNRKNINFDDAWGAKSNENVGKNILQTLSLSMAYAPVDSLVAQGASQFGFGLKFSILRGKTSEEFLAEIGKLNDLLRQQGQDFNQKAEAELQKDSSYKALMKLYTEKLATSATKTDSILVRTLPAAIEKLENEIKNSFIKNYKGNLEDKRLAIMAKLEKMDVSRKGAFMDFAAGAVVDFPTRIFDYSEINKYGAWLTGGYDGKKVSFLALGRMLQNKKTPYLTDSSFVATGESTALDFGGRLIYKKDKFNASVEALYRNYLNTDKYNTGWKGTFYLSYDLGSNKLLTLNISRDFNGTIDKKGTLVTALNLIIGLGSNRKVDGGK